MLFKEIGFGISLNNQRSCLDISPLPIRKEKSGRRFFLPQVSLISLLQKFNEYT